MSKLPRLLPLIAIAIGGVIAVRAVGAGPDLFQGARALAETTAEAGAEAAASTGATASAPAVCALSPEQLAEQAGISPAELRIIQSLSARREALDARDADFATTLPLMVAAEQRLDARIAELEAIRAEVTGLLGQADEREQQEVDRLVQVYSAMRPREAARVMSTLHDDVRLPVAAAMRPRALAAILAQMEPAAARELTEKLARRYESRQLAARAAVAGTGGAEAPAPPRTNAEAAPAAQPPAPRQTPAPRQAANRAAAQPPRQTPAQPAAQPAGQPAGQRTTPPSENSSEAAAAMPQQAPEQAPARSPAAPRQSVN